MRRLLVPLAWMLIGASLVATWFLVATGSSDLDDDSELTPSRVVAVESVVRDATAQATLVVSYPGTDVPSQLTGRLTGITADVPATLPSAGVVWGEVDGRPRVLVGSANVFAFSRDLARGSRGGDVETLQEFLADLGFYSGSVDGRFGSGVEAALEDFRASIDAETGDKVLQVGDLAFADPDAEFEPASLVVGTDLTPSTPIGSLRPTQPTLELRFFPKDAALVVEGSQVSGEAFVGVVSGVDLEPLAIDGGGTVRIGVVEGDLNRPVAVGEILQVLVTVDAAPRLWLPLGAIALDATGQPYALTPTGDRISVVLGDDSGGFVEVLSGARGGTDVVVPNPDLFEDP